MLRSTIHTLRSIIPNRKVLTAAFTVAAPMLLGGMTAKADGFNQLYVFGDSLSDVGNAYIASDGAEPGPPYSNGQFTNGNVWAQDLASLLGLPALKPSLSGGTDYAVGGALSGTANAGDLLNQVSAFSASLANPKGPTAAATNAAGSASAAGSSQSGANPNGLYAIWIGSNDLNAILSSNSSNPAAAALGVVANVDQTISELAQDGAKNFLVVTVPDMGKTPLAISAGPAGEAAASALSGFFDQSLVNGYGPLPSLGTLATGLGITIDTLDTYSLVDAAVANPSAYGFTNVTQPCLTGATNYSGGTACSDPNSYLFWDDLHPTAAAQEIVAQAALAAVPEPSALTMILGGGGLTAALAFARRRRNGNDLVD